MNQQKELLEKLRSALIGQMHVQPYIIYDDNTLQLLLEKKPKTMEELTSIKGFPKGGKRVSSFGAQILAIFNDADSISDFSVSESGFVSAVPQRMEL